MKRLITILFAIFCAVTLSQFPEFAQQYKQRLGGAVDELSRIVTKFDADAYNSGLKREEALDRYSQADDPFLSKQGTNMRKTISRFEYLRNHLAELSDAAPFTRLWVFAKDRDFELSKATLDAYEPAVPTSVEGAVHAAGGFFGGWWLFVVLLSPFGRRRRRSA